jgi:hypothetical protein
MLSIAFCSGEFAIFFETPHYRARSQIIVQRATFGFRKAAELIADAIFFSRNIARQQ